MSYEKMLDVSMVAKRLKMHPIRVRERIRAGEIKAIDIGRGTKPIYRISEKAYDDYIKACEVLEE